MLDLVQTIEDLVAKPFFADLVPEVFNGVEFGAVGRQVYDPHILWHNEIAGHVPSGFVHDHENEFIRMSARYLLEEDRHSLGADLREDERIEYSIVRGNGSICVCVLANHMARYRWPYSRWSPADFWVADSTEAGFILKHEPNRSAQGSLPPSLSCYFDFEFFLKPS